MKAFKDIAFENLMTLRSRAVRERRTVRMADDVFRSIDKEFAMLLRSIKRGRISAKSYKILKVNVIALDVNNPHLLNIDISHIHGFTIKIRHDNLNTLEAFVNASWNEKEVFPREYMSLDGKRYRVVNTGEE